MRRGLTPILITASLLAGCDEAPGIRSYQTTRPAAYTWPETAARDVTYEAGGAQWTWQIPAGWVEAPEVPDALVADFRFKGKDEALPGRMTVSMIPGDAGGIQANVMRWRQQLFLTTTAGLGPDDVVSQPMGSEAMDITIVQLAGQFRGPNVPTHLLGAIIRLYNVEGGVVQTWFFKMVGDAETLADNWLLFSRIYLSFRPAGMDAPDLPSDLSEPGPGPLPPREERPFLARPIDQRDDASQVPAPDASEGGRP